MSKKKKAEEMLVICRQCNGTGSEYDEVRGEVIECHMCQGFGKLGLDKNMREEEKSKIAKRNRRRGKRTERRVSEKLEGLRIGILGGADVITDRFAVEVKSRKRIVIVQWWEKTRKNAEKLRKEPLLVVHEYGKKRYFVVMELEQFKKLMGG